MAWPTGKSRKEYNNQRLSQNKPFDIVTIIGHSEKTDGIIDGGVGDCADRPSDNNNNPSPLSIPLKQKGSDGEIGINGLESRAENSHKKQKGDFVDEIEVVEGMKRLLECKWSEKRFECVCVHCRAFGEMVRVEIGKILKGE